MEDFKFDKIILKPEDVDLSYSPLRKNIKEETYVLGAFNPGMSRLKNGNLIIMVRVAEALKNPIHSGKIFCIRKDITKGYVLDGYKLDDVDVSDPRIFSIKKFLPTYVCAVTSISWILPVELSEDGGEIVKIHYDKIISPQKSYQEYGIEDARVSFIDDKYYMTTCSVSSERQCTTLYSSTDGLNYHLEGIVLDHQNKDMLLFEGKINGLYHAMTRPLGFLYFATAKNCIYNPGPSINLSKSKDLLYWKPEEKPFIRANKKHVMFEKIGGGAQPILTPQGWLILFHGVETKNGSQIYRTYWAILDKDNPTKILFSEMDKPLLEANNKLTKNMQDKIYLNNVVFTTGIVDGDDKYIVASGELDLCVRITHIPKSRLTY
ncbi:MAG: glycosidase [Bacteroidetes bacterium]|nr:glycosidase [Bacteroidota bacterium]